MSGHMQTLSFPAVADLVGAVLHRVTDIGRALLRKEPAENNPATVKAVGSGRNGTVFLVGAGPGDPELLTVKARRALQAADVILHDQLVSAEVLALAPPNVERINVGKKGYGRACRQGDINDLMITLANAGRRVVRLKAGDPLMFGRLEEEVAALEDAGVGYAIVPGISAAQGAARTLGVGLTRRRGTRRFQAITGHASDGRLPGDFDWSGVADPRAITAVYMPKATIGVLCAELIRRGLPTEHPAVAVFNATRADEHIVAASIGTLPARLASVDTGAPCIILIGVAARQRAAAMRASAPEPATACV
jgi:uroporphyrin-III C-methyltransferase / precorrin-2 dehydrogenase / sirohydrochlorin ferrochelatase